MKGVLGLILAVALLPASSLASSDVDALPDVPQNLTAPPYWTAPAVSLGDGDHGERVALASGRQALVTSPVPLPFVAITPCRQYNSLSSSALADNTPRTVALIGAPCAIPSDAAAVAANITVFNISGAGSNGVFRAGTVSPPTTAWINYPPTETQRANAGVLPLGAGGTIVVQVNQGAGSVDLVVDVFGYYSPLGIVNHVNGLTGDVTLSPGSNVSITPSGNTLTIDAVAGGPPSGPAGGSLSGTYPNPGIAAGTIGVTQLANATAVRSINGAAQDLVTLQGSGAVSVSTAGSTITIGAPGGVTSVAGTNGISASPSTGAVTVTSSATSANTASTLVARDSGGSFNASGITLTGDLSLPSTNAAQTAGVLKINGLPFLHAFGSDNTFLGSQAGNGIMTGGFNTGVGPRTLSSNTTGMNNSAFGVNALTANQTSNANSAFGSEALAAHTGVGFNAAFGAAALKNNTIGNDNAAVGASALQTNVSGFQNTAMGSEALFLSTGANNTVLGALALRHLTSGDGNIAIGSFVGLNLVSGSSNIYLGATGNATESNTIRLGSGLQTSAFMDGIFGQTSASGVAVFVNSLGKLGTTTSSKRFKEEIVDMDAESDVLLKLRPVSFFYKPEYDPSRTRQYGLIAEEVAEVAPALAVFDKDGRPETVRYHLVNAMLLNEVQKNRRLIDELRAERTELRAERIELRRRLDALEQRLSRAIDARPN